MANFNSKKLIELVSKGSFSGVFLDLDDTLYDYGICHDFALKQSYKIWKKKTKDSFEFFLVDYKSAQSVVKVFTSNQSSSHSRFLYFQKMSERKLGRSCVEFVIDLERKYWSSFFAKMKLRSGVKEFLIKLKKDNVKICIVTDLTSSLQFSKLIKLKLTNLVDFIVTSEEAGQEKPALNIFELAQSKIQLPKEKLLLIGDDKDKDEKGARDFGIAFSYFS